MTMIYLVGCGLYVSLLILGVWLTAKEADGRALFHYYKPDKRRGGYVSDAGGWVPQKILWREWGWYGLSLLIFLLAPLIGLYVILWELLIVQILWGSVPGGLRNSIKKCFGFVTAAGKREGQWERQGELNPKPIYAGGDGSSKETAVLIDTNNPMVGPRAVDDYARERHHMRTLFSRIEVRAGGRDYDVLTFELEDGTEKYYWFDITRFAGNRRRVA